MFCGVKTPRSGQRERLRNKSFQSVKAVIDIGSNSIKLRVVCKQGRLLRTLVDTTEVVRLGKGLAAGILDEETIRHGVEVVCRLTHRAAEMGATPRVVGTMALRVAQNAEDFVRRVRSDTGIAVEILSGEEEARLAWLGATYGLDAPKGNVAVFDAGGGSTELIFGVDSRITALRSVPVGAVSLTERFFDTDPVNPGSVEAALCFVRALLISADLPQHSMPFVIGLGGGVAAIASVKLKLPSFVPKTLDGTFLARNDIMEQAQLYASLTLNERTNIAGLSSKRADIILASACIVQCVLEALDADSFQVSINGLRHGLLVEMFQEGENPHHFKEVE